MASYAHIYLSPHLDDAVLSCGGRIWQQTQAGIHVQVVSIFAGTPAADEPLSPFAQELHARWGHQIDAAARRREEDLAALEILGSEAIHWPYTDCIYRQTIDGYFPYASEESLWEEVHPAERGLIEELAAKIAALPLSPDGLVHAPLGIGHHVDHQITRRAAKASRRTLGYYADYPYAEDPTVVQTALESTERQWQEELVLLSQPALEAKISAIACYRSQLSTFWSNLAEMEARIRAFAEQTGNGTPAERYWTLKPENRYPVSSSST
jgi:LmbE family N-acetylglucosaminyl deacetylase